MPKKDAKESGAEQLHFCAEGQTLRARGETHGKSETDAPQ
jgi:hypothetical protein